MGVHQWEKFMTAKALWPSRRPLPKSGIGIQWEAVSPQPEGDGTAVCDAAQVWVCGACGKQQDCGRILARVG